MDCAHRCTRERRAVGGATRRRRRVEARYGPPPATEQTGRGGEGALGFGGAGPEGEERFARWIGGDDWRQRDTLHRLFAEAEPVRVGLTSTAADSA